MAKRLLLEAGIREHVGTKSAALIRKDGRIPAIVYGHKKKPIAVSVNTHDFTEALHHGHRLMDIKIGGDKETVLVKDLQYDELGKNVIHADLLIVGVTERVEVTVPIEFKGEPKGSAEGGVIETQADSVEVECLVTNIPEILTVSIKELDVGDTLHAKDIELPAGVKLISAPDILVVSCSTVAEEPVVEEVEAEAVEAPEVIGEAKKAEEGPSEGEQTEEKGEKK